ncbi:MAG: hypothetical protein NDJ90_00215 [Oligoflexia bacterium]|nr:hypothetical protein [Oligoflexia bacterium]
MKYLALLASLALHSLFLPSAAAADALAMPGLVEVDSVFSDKVTRKPDRFKGVGIVLSYKGRAFVMTKAHVSQGQDVRIEGAPAQLVGRLADNDEADLELFEIPTKGAPKGLAAFDPIRNEFVVDRTVLKQWPTDRRFPLVTADGSPSEWTALLPSSLKAATLSNVSLGPAFGVLNRVADPDPDFYIRDHSIQEPYSASENFFPAKFPPGTSGSPLIKTESGGRAVLGGTVTRHLRNRIGSFATDPHQVTQLFRSYLSGKRGNPGKVQMALRNGVIYRIYPDGTEEINAGSISVSGGPDTAGSSGGPDTAGSSGGPDTAGSGSSRSGTLALDLTDAYSKHDLLPGFIYKGRPAVALKGVSEDGESQYAPGSIDGLRLLEFEGAKKIEALAPGFPVPELMKARFNTKEDAFTLRTQASPDERAPPRQIRYQNGELHVLISDLGSGRSTLSFSLDRQGKLVGSSYPGFVPIIHVSDPKTGERFSVDLTSLFFENPDVSIRYGAGVPLRGDRRLPRNIVPIVNLETGAEYRLPFYLEASDETLLSTHDDLKQALGSLAAKGKPCP